MNDLVKEEDQARKANESSEKNRQMIHTKKPGNLLENFMVQTMVKHGAIDRGHQTDDDYDEELADAAEAALHEARAKEKADREKE